MSVGNGRSTGSVAAVVGIDSSFEEGHYVTAEQEKQILAVLTRAIEGRGCGTFDGAERTSTQVLWYFLGDDPQALETALLPVLRNEPCCSGGLLRITSNGVVGPWRQVRI